MFAMSRKEETKGISGTREEKFTKEKRNVQRTFLFWLAGSVKIWVLWIFLELRK
jgi:hypothetical protein